MSKLSDINSCLMTGSFDFSSSATVGKRGPKQEIYRLNTLRMNNVSDVEEDYGFAVIETKNKVRGHGKALVLRFESSPGKDFELLGWGLDITATTVA